MSKTGRNDPCPCGSGKKFKKCCEPNMIKGKFLAKKMQTSSSKMSSFFSQNVAKETPFTLKGRSISVSSQKLQNTASSNKSSEKPPESTEEPSNEKKKSDENT